MLCITIAKLGGCREGKMITFPASFRSSNYNCHTDNLVSEVHIERILGINVAVNDKKRVSSLPDFCEELDDGEEDSE